MSAVATNKLRHSLQFGGLAKLHKQSFMQQFRMAEFFKIELKRRKYAHDVLCNSQRFGIVRGSAINGDMRIDRLHVIFFGQLADQQKELIT